MARYIDADLIKEKLQRTIINGQTAFINNVLIGLLDKAPTEDVQKVVHCRDCGHYDGKCCVTLPGHPIVMRKPNEFCSRGAKMDGDVE
jgi:hypothetical protein